VSNDQVLRQLVTLNSAISQLTNAVSKLQSDVAEHLSGSRQKDVAGKLMFYK